MPTHAIVLLAGGNGRLAPAGRVDGDVRRFHHRWRAFLNENDHAWPALLAARLAANKATANIGVANMGIGGNRVLRDGSGVSALAALTAMCSASPA